MAVECLAEENIFWWAEFTLQTTTINYNSDLIINLIMLVCFVRLEILEK